MAPRITRITAIPVRVPVPPERINCPQFAHEPLNRGPTGGWDGPWVGDVPFTIVKVGGSDGGPAGWCSTTRGRDAAVVREVAARLLGRSRERITPLEHPGADTYYRGLHTAALDWRARGEGLPLYRLFGEKIRDRIKAAQFAGFCTPTGAAARARQAQAEGFTSLKLKANLELDAPGIAAAVKDACGEHFELVIDPNGRWETTRIALERARAIAAVSRSVYLEDPVYGTDAIDALAQIRRQGGVGTIKTLIGADGIRAAADAGAIDAINLQGTWPLLLEGSAEAARLGIPYWLGSSLECGLSDLATMHFAATQEQFLFPCELAGNMTREHDLLAAPIRYEHGFALLPEGPGLGIDADEDAIERYRVGDPVIVG